MCLKRILLAFLTILVLASRNAVRVNCLRLHRTSIRARLDTTSNRSVTLGGKTIPLFHHKPHQPLFSLIQNLTLSLTSTPTPPTTPSATQNIPQIQQQNPLLNSSQFQAHNPHQKPIYPTVTSKPSPTTTIVDQFDNRYPDGSYEFRYELPDETVRYERGYFVQYQGKRILVVKGYYSYRLPDLRYLTVFYTADQYGYRQDSSTFSFNRPQLPRSLNPGLELKSESDLNVSE